MKKLEGGTKVMQTRRPKVTKCLGVRKERNGYQEKNKWQVDRERAAMVEKAQNEVLGATTAGPKSDVTDVMSYKLVLHHTKQGEGK